MLSSWFAPAERGTYWGMWNVAHNFGGFAAPLVAGFAARTYGTAPLCAMACHAGVCGLPGTLGLKKGEGEAGEKHIV
jgi:sugar phosphate permease